MRGKRCSWRDVRVWLKEHDWKSCIRQKRIWGSNPHLSASDFSKAPVWALSFSPAPLVADTYLGRVAERLNAAVSKTVLPVIPGNEGSNPSPSASVLRSAFGGPFSYRQSSCISGSIGAGPFSHLVVAHRGSAPCTISCGGTFSLGWGYGTCPHTPNLHGWVVLVGGVWVGLFCSREYTGLHWFRRKGKGRPW